jgi:methanogenic corrinoid protein MtbC1
MEELVSPKQVARAMGVSESSLKRWCDKGLIPTIRTAGGHRKLPIGAVLNFLREKGKQLVRPEILGLPAISGTGENTLDRAAKRLVAALTTGDSEQARRILFDQYLAGQSMIEISDQVIAEAFNQIGDGWQCGELEVYQERRGCEIMQRLLHELNLSIPQVPLDAPLAIGGTLEGDYYQLPTAMVELVLREQGWNARSFGTNLTAATVCESLRELHPQLFWLSVSRLDDLAKFVADYQLIAAAAHELKIPVVIGGRELTAVVRKQLRFNAHCDNMRQLADFSATFPRVIPTVNT